MRNPPPQLPVSTGIAETNSLPSSSRRKNCTNLPLFVYASPEPGIPTGRQYVPAFGLLILMTLRLALE
jgi:hypothetical protein